MIITIGIAINIRGIGGHPVSYISRDEDRLLNLSMKNMIFTIIILLISSKNASASACEMKGFTLSGKNGGTVTLGCVP